MLPPRSSFLSALTCPGILAPGSAKQSEPTVTIYDDTWKRVLHVLFLAEVREAEIFSCSHYSEGNELRKYLAMVFTGLCSLCRLGSVPPAPMQKSVLVFTHPGCSNAVGQPGCAGPAVGPVPSRWCSGYVTAPSPVSCQNVTRGVRCGLHTSSCTQPRSDSGG